MRRGFPIMSRRPVTSILPSSRSFREYGRPLKRFTGMTLRLTLLAAAAFLPTALAQTSDSRDLAAGYATAFQQMGRSKAAIVYLTANATEVVEVREILAFGGVVRVRTVDGRHEILDPARIVRIQTR